MREFGKDLRFGFRMLLKRPGTSGLAIIALALGIGLTTTMFSIVDGAFLRGLPFERSDQIVALTRQRVGGRGGGSVPLHDFVDWRTGQHSFEDLAASSNFPANISTSGDLPERNRGASITPNTLRLLRVKPALGRDFTAADSEPGAPPVAIISDTMWLGRFQRAHDVLGQPMRINGESTLIVGVMPARFGFPHTEDVWLPLHLTLPATRGEGQQVEVMGRLKSGLSLAAAQADMALVAGQLAQQYPENKDMTAFAQPYVRRFIGQQVVATLSTMLGAVVGVLLIACVNVTNLQLARAAERTKEMAVRVALGATRVRLVQQLLVEGLLLSTMGALIGLGIAQIGITLFNRGIADTNPPFWIDIRVDGRVLAVVTALTLLAAIASSLVPALRVARQSVNDVLKDEGRSSTGLRVGVFSRALVTVEMVLSCVLLVVSGLMIKSVIATSAMTFPFDTGLLVARMNMNDRDYPDDARVRQVMERVCARVAGAPGVRGVAVATTPPSGGGTTTLSIDGQPPPANDAQKPSVRRVEVSPAFFQVLRVGVHSGRAIDETDREGSLQVAMVSEDFVRRFFPKGDALGRRIQTGGNPKGVWWTIVGIVPPLAVAPQPGDVTELVFVPLTQAPSRDVMLYVATSGPPTSAGPAVRHAVMEVDPNLPIFDINSLKGQYDQGTWPFRVFGGLFMTFGLAALLMAAAGLYGVMSFAVRRRTQEIGVRMALGADRRRIIAMVLRQGVWQIGLGVTIGLGFGGLLGSQLKLLLFHVQPWDPVVFSGTVGVLSSAGILACLVPARRAASVDPLVALREN